MNSFKKIQLEYTATTIHPTKESDPTFSFGLLREIILGVPICAQFCSKHRVVSKRLGCGSGTGYIIIKESEAQVVTCINWNYKLRMYFITISALEKTSTLFSIQSQQSKDVGRGLLLLHFPDHKKFRWAWKVPLLRTRKSSWLPS